MSSLITSIQYGKRDLNQQRQKNKQVSKKTV